MKRFTAILFLLVTICANGAVFSVTNRTTSTLWTFDTNGMTGVARRSDFGAAGIALIAGTNVTASTNGTLVTMNANVSAASVIAVTNGYPWGSLYDTAGAAQQATNGYPWGALYDAVGAAQRATNGYPWGALYDAVGAAQRATNGYPWNWTPVAGVNVTLATNGTLVTFSAAGGGGGGNSIDVPLAYLQPWDAHSNYAIDFGQPAWYTCPTSSWNFSWSTNWPGSASTSRLTTIFIPLTNFNRTITITNWSTNWNFTGISQPFTLMSNFAAKIQAQIYGPGETNVTVHLDVLNHQAGYSPYTAFNPLSISGLLLWLKADVGCFSDQAATIPCGDGALVGVWKDQSGHGNDMKQSNLTSQPRWASHATIWSTPAVWFNAGGLTNATAIGSQPFHVFAVVSLPNGAGASGMVIWNSTNSSYASQMYYLNASTPGGTFRLYDGANVLYGGTNLFRWQEIGSTYNGNSTTLWTNGVAAVSGTFGTAPLEGFTLGSEVGGSVDPTTGWISEVLIYAATLTAQNLTDIQTYLITKYGIL